MRETPVRRNEEACLSEDSDLIDGNVARARRTIAASGATPFGLVVIAVQDSAVIGFSVLSGD
jgi:hypothetical protein